jgi:hypothetical protein
VLGTSVVRIDPSIAQAQRAAAFARKRNGRKGTGRTRYVTSGDLAAFRANVALIIGDSDDVLSIAAAPGS